MWGSALRLTTSAHRLIDRISGGRLLRRFPGGAQVIWIETLGRRSGQWRRTPLLAVPTANGWGIAGSNAGQEKTPGWVFNVRAHAEGQLEIDGVSEPCAFTELHGEEADSVYAALCRAWGGYRMYQRNIRRPIPIFSVRFLRDSTGH
jgi:deazaflavin-dependent oxidoreductase (nitroreductase family)